MIKLLKNLKRKDWLLILAAIISMVLSVYLSLAIPGYMAEITKFVETSSGTDVIWGEGIKMILSALGVLVCDILSILIMSLVSSNFASNLRSKLFAKVESFSLKEINEFSTSSLITRSTNDVTQIQNMIAIGLLISVIAPVTAVWAFFKIWGQNASWTIATLVGIVCVILMLAFIMKYVVPKFKKVQTLTDNVNRVARENLTGLSVVRAYNAEKYEEKKFETVNHELFKNNLQINRRMAILFPGIKMIMNGLSLAIYCLGAGIINSIGSFEGQVQSFSDMVVFSSYSMQILISFMMLTMIFVMLPRAQVSAKRINEVLNVIPKITDGVGCQGKTLGEIEFKNVSFKYHKKGDPVLSNISFKANKGNQIAIIGATGSGKTSLLNLIPRLYDVSSGEILVDGENVKNYKLEALRNKIGFVPQKAVLFSGTINSNIEMAGLGDEKSIDENSKEKAIRIAQADEFVNNMDGENNAQISQGGANVSGGQKQRLAIARAIARKPEILIFDDSFSALDFSTDKKLREALSREIGGTTSIIVSQRIGTIKNADLIIVLENGKIVGKGTHDELLQSCDVYQEIALSQISKEEL